ncbi:hypothetical protein [uncultured Gammaproteobacteria bacterium]|jgi:hypothetical protein|nr:hypothetical protein [uncultured Gammaproteobacteria bacterium]
MQRSYLGVKCKQEENMQAVVFVGYIVLGLFQSVAIMAGLEDWVGLH